MRGKIVFRPQIHTEHDGEEGRAEKRAEWAGPSWGTVAIEVTHTQTNEPQRVREFYTIDGWTNRKHYEHLLGKEAVYRHGQGFQVFTDYGFKWLPTEGERPIVVLEDIPPPSRVRSPLRWNNGRWQKQLKRGWVTA